MRVVTVLLLALSGCASMFAGDSETIRFETEPSGQTISVGGTSYTTPADVLLGRDRDHEVTWPDGSKSTVARGMNGWFLANIIWFPLGVVVFMPIDLISGEASANLSPELLVWRSGEGVVVPAMKRSDAGKEPKVEPRYP